MKKIKLVISIILLLAVMVYVMINYIENKKEKIIKKFVHNIYKNKEFAKIQTNYPKVVNRNSSIGSDALGVSTNPFGIQDNVLAYILKNIPESNESAVYAAIRLIQYDDLVMFSDNAESALFFMKEAGIPIACLTDALGDIPSNKIIRETHDLNVNTFELKRLDKRANQFLAWKIISPDISNYEITKICEKGNY